MEIFLTVERAFDSGDGHDGDQEGRCKVRTGRVAIQLTTDPSLVWT